MKLASFVIVAMVLAAALSLTLAAAPACAQDETATDFSIYCAKCHGTEGHGDGPNASTLNTKPRDFTDCATMKKIDDATIFKAIKEGGAAVNLPNDMPPWGQAFDDSEIKKLAAYVRTFCKQ